MPQTEDGGWLLDDSEIDEDVYGPGAKIPPDIHDEPHEFHLAGKHDQSTHGRGGGGIRKGGSYGSTDADLAVAASDGKPIMDVQSDFFPHTGGGTDMHMTAAEYKANQVAAVDHLMRDNKWGDSEKIVGDDSNFFEEGGYSSVGTDKTQNAINLAAHVPAQKALIAERLSKRMDEKLADVSTEDIIAARDEMNQHYGLFQGPHFSTNEVDYSDAPRSTKLTGKAWVNSPDFRHEQGVSRKLVDQREAAINDLANGYHRSWAKTANKGFPPAVAIQDSVNKKYVKPKEKEWGIASDSYAGTGKLHPGTKANRAKAQALREMGNGWAGRTVDAYTESVYEETQAAFKKDKIKSLSLHRGTKRGNVEQWEKKTYRTNPASSWTRSKKTGKDFSGGQDVLSITVPVERIWSTAATGAGCYKEEEFIVLGGTHEAMGSSGYK